MYVELCEKFIAEEIFLGKSPKNYTDKEYLGNTILLKMKNNIYIHIDSCIKKFKYNTEIIDFISPIGVSDIPLPYAIDKDYNYILINQKIIFKGIKNLEVPVLFYNKYLDKIKSKKLDIKTIKCSPDY